MSNYSPGRNREPIDSLVAAPISQLAKAARPTVISEFRALVVAIIAGVSTFEPTFALRWGGVVCAAVLCSKLTSIKLGSTDVYMCCLGVLPALSLLWTVRQDATLLAAQNHLAFLAVFLSVRVVTVNHRTLTIVASGYVIGCLYAVAALFRDNPTMLVRLTFDAEASRFGLEGLNQNYMASSLATGMAVIVLLWATQRLTVAGRAAMVSVVILLYLGVIQNGGRGALVALALMGVWLVACKMGRPPLGLLYALVTVVNLLIVTGVADSFLRSQIARSARETGDLNGRLQTWPFAREFFLDHPLIGAGAGVFNNFNPLGLAAHNAILDIGTGMGMLGVFFFVAALYTGLVSGTRESEPRKRALLVGTVIAVSAPILASGFWNESPAFWVAVGLFSRMAVALESAQPECKGSVLRLRTGDQSSATSRTARGQGRSKSTRTGLGDASSRECPI